MSRLIKNGVVVNKAKSISDRGRVGGKLNDEATAAGGELSGSVSQKNTSQKVFEAAMSGSTASVASPVAGGDIAGKGLSESFSAEKIAQIEKEAYEKAYEKGIEKAREAGKKELNDKIVELEEFYKEEQEKVEKQLASSVDTLKNVIESIEKEKAVLVDSVESNVILLVLQCLYKLAGENDVYKKVVENTVAREVKQHFDQPFIKVQLPNKDKEALAFIETVNPETCRVTFDSNLGSGECLIEAGHSVTESGMLSQLEQLKEQLIRTLRERS